MEQIDYELKLFSLAMDTLVSASQLKFDAFRKDYHFSSVGVPGYGTIDTFDRLAGALNYKGYRTRTGKYICGNYLKQIKYKLLKRYGKEAVEDLVDWGAVSSNYYH